MSILIESPDGKERCHVDSLDGYEGWTVVAKGAACRPKECCAWDEQSKTWKKDPAKVAKRDQEARHNMPRKDLLAVIDALESRIEALEQRANANP